MSVASGVVLVALLIFVLDILAPNPIASVVFQAPKPLVIFKNHHRQT
jgi:hypothetical protein